MEGDMVQEHTWSVGREHGVYGGLGSGHVGSRLTRSFLVMLKVLAYSIVILITSPSFSFLDGDCRTSAFPVTSKS